MHRALLTQKGKQQQAFVNDERIVVTYLHVEPTYIIGFRTQLVDGYWALKVAYGAARLMERVSKPMRGLLKAASVQTPLRHTTEFRIDPSLNPTLNIENPDKPTLTVGDKTYHMGMHLKATELFAIGDTIRVTGTSKGKGFQGVMKRHGFAGGPASHGQSDRERSPGSIGQRTIPGRVYKGKKMAGRMGSDRITIKGLRIETVADELLTIRGLVPGGPHAIVAVYKINS